MRLLTVRILSSGILALCLCCSTVLAAGTGLPPGTWKLRSQRTVAGNPPSYSPGLVMTYDGAGNVTRMSTSAPTAIVGRDRMKFTLSAGGRVLTQESKGVDQKGKPYRYVLTWDRQ
jgi:hypothetical protein